MVFHFARIFIFLPVFVWKFSLQFAPQVPGYSQYLVLNEDGSFNYGYSIGESSSAGQISSSPDYVWNRIRQSVELKGTQKKPSDLFSKISSNASLNINKSQVYDTNKFSRDQNLLPNGQDSPVNILNPDGTYAFSYTNSDSSYRQSADAGNNVQGKYSYQNEAGSHDLSYISGAKTGFYTTGGSLALPNGLNSRISKNPVLFYSVPFQSPPHNDSSYSFEYSTPLQSRQEIGDSKNNVYGRYSFVNEEGDHDLLYVAGSSTGFLPIGGSILKSSSVGITDKIIPKISFDNKTDLKSLVGKFKTVADEKQRNELNASAGTKQQEILGKDKILKSLASYNFDTNLQREKISEDQEIRAHKSDNDGFHIQNKNSLQNFGFYRKDNYDTVSVFVHPYLPWFNVIGRINRYV